MVTCPHQIKGDQMSFADDYIEHRNLLDREDFARAERMLADGMTHERALHYLRGWAQDYAHEMYCDDCAARDFAEQAYGRTA